MVGLRDIYVLAAHHEQLLWQSQPLPPHQPLPPPQNPNPNSTPSCLQKPSPSGILFVAGGPSACQDCGNQAKKDCTHRRCRTCCKSRGYDCSTHIRSTWIPAARRRDRHLSTSDSAAALKKPRLLSSQTTTASHTSNSNTPPRSFDTGSSHQDPSFPENLPGQVQATALFKCVRVTSIDEGEDEYAYHAKVNIGGHVFKGFLYNQGFDQGIFSTEIAGTSPAVDVDNNVNNAGGGSIIPNFSELHVGVGGGVRNVPQSDIYGLGGLLGGAAFGNAIN